MKTYPSPYTIQINDWEWGNKYRKGTNYSPQKALRRVSPRSYTCSGPYFTKQDTWVIKVSVGLEQQCLKDNYIFQKRKIRAKFSGKHEWGRRPASAIQTMLIKLLQKT